MKHQILGAILAIFLIGTISSATFAAADDKDKNFKILTGTGTPANSLGKDGDLYINTSNGNYYQKDNSKWSLKGNLTGPKGDTGATGDTGPQGPPGVGGAFSIYVKTSAQMSIAPQTTGFVRASCNVGDFVTGGGFESFGQGVNIFESTPHHNAIANVDQWEVHGNNTSSASVNIQAHVLCAHIATP